MAAAEALRGRWGCRRGADGESPSPPLPPSLAAVETAACAKMGTRPRGCCPLRSVYHPDPHTLELLDAWMGVRGARLTWPDALGRPLTAIDAPCIVALAQADAQRQRMDLAWRREHPDAKDDEEV